MIIIFEFPANLFVYLFCFQWCAHFCTMSLILSYAVRRWFLTFQVILTKNQTSRTLQLKYFSFWQVPAFVRAQDVSLKAFLFQINNGFQAHSKWLLALLPLRTVHCFQMVAELWKLFFLFLS